MDTHNIAHLDHGGTTFVDARARQPGAFRENPATIERAPGANRLERER